MALSLEEILEQIDTLETAKATGQLVVAYRDKSVRYRDLDEIDRILNWLYNRRNELAPPEVVAATPSGRAKQTRMITRMHQ